MVNGLAYKGFMVQYINGGWFSKQMVNDSVYKGLIVQYRMVY